MTDELHNQSALNSKKLVGFKEEFIYLNNFLMTNNFPGSLLISGKKGIGKCTFIFHLLNNFFSKNDYNLETMEINSNSIIFKKINNLIFQNIIFLSTDIVKKITIEDIRKLRNTIEKTTLNNLPRFIILDDIELININSINALLKTLEEPSVNNHFILINNNQKNLLDTVSSRCLKFNIYQKKKIRNDVIKHLFKKNNLVLDVSYLDNDITPGLYLKFIIICNSNNIKFNGDYLFNIQKIFSLYRKNKDMVFINLLFFITDDYFYKLASKQKTNIDLVNNTRMKTIELINNFVKYNLNISSTYNEIQMKFIYG